MVVTGAGLESCSVPWARTGQSLSVCMGIVMGKGETERLWGGRGKRGAEARREGKEGEWEEEGAKVARGGRQGTEVAGGQ